MAWRLLWKLRKVLGIALLACLLIALYLGSSSMPTTYKNTDGRGKFFATNLPLLHDVPNVFESESTVNLASTATHRLGIVVPYRDRFEELLTFVPYMHRYLEHKGISHEIFVVNQVDGLRFNRASLINVGFLYATSHDKKDGLTCDYIAMHDVDLLPLNYDLPYDFPGEGTAMHVAAPGLHPKYNYPTFIGGILVLTASDFLKVNGMSNIYYGWGMEDDEFYVRLKHNNVEVTRPLGITTDRSDTFRHAHSPKVRPRDTAKCYDQFNKTKRRDRLTGLTNLNYTLLSTSHITIDGAPIVLLNAKLQCDTTISPWCDCSNSPSGKNNTQKKPNQNKIKSTNRKNQVKKET